MNICLISEEFPPETGRGGIGTYVYNLGLGLAELGHRVHVISRGWGDDTVQEDAGLRLYRVSVPEPSWGRATHYINLHFYEIRQILLWNLRVSQVVSRISEVEALDVIESPEYHAQGLFTTFRQRRVPMVVKLHSPAFLLRGINGVTVDRSWLDIMVSERLEYHLARRARLVTSPSRKLAEDIARHWCLDVSTISVIRYPMDIELFCPSADALRDEYTLLYVGRVERRKGVETLVEALPAILDAFPRSRLRLVGWDHCSGPGGSSMSSHLRKRLRDLGLPEGAVKFVGQMDRTALPRIYRSAAVCVVPSLYENFPYTCLEAMACGCAVVASGVGGIPEIITDQVDGLLVPPNSPEALAAAVILLLSDPPLRRRLGDRAQATVRDRYSRAVICAETVRAYRSVQT